MKYAFEVEGRYKGLLTIFVTVDEIPKITREVHHHYPFQSIYVSDPEGKLQDFTFIDIWNSKLIFIETHDFSNIPDAYRDRVKLMYRVNDPNIYKLRLTDQVKFRNPEDNLNVWTISVEELWKTIPKDFDDDWDIPEAKEHIR